VRDFKLSDKFLEPYQTREVAWPYGDLSYTTFKSKYARFINEDPTERTEEWHECVRRVVEGVFSIQKQYCRKNGLEWVNNRGQKSAQVMFDKIFNFKFTPPGRGLWIMGSPVIDKIGSAALQNCAFISTENLHVDFAEPFLFLMDMSMLGVGVGFDTKGAGKVCIQERGVNGSTLVIDDSREGWCDALRVTLMSYMGGPKYNLDYSRIRKKGSVLKTFGGIAPGPQPLIDLCEKDIPSILDPIVGEEITSVVIVDIANYVGKCVVSGNVRRTAELGIGDADDKDFFEMKNWKKFERELDDRRKFSNNSIYGSIGMDYGEITENILANGEPGVIWMDNVHAYGRFADGKLDPDDFYWDFAKGFNPCVEQPLEDHEMCTLVETYPANHDSPEEFIETLKYAYMYGKTVTLLSTHNKKSNAVMMRNRRIGTSMSGIEQAITVFGKRAFFQEFCDAGYKEIRRWDRIYSNWLGVPRSIRVTTVKPSGTVSLLAGASPGVHKPIARRYIRYVKWDSASPYIEIFDKAGYLVEDDLGGDPNTKHVLFPVEEVKECRYTEQETTIWEQFQMAADIQRWWSDNGVSCTIKFDPKTEAGQIEDCLSTYESRLKAISLLPKTGHGYKQAPYTMVSDHYEEQDRSVDGHRVIWTNDEWKAYRKQIKSRILRREMAKIGARAEGESGCTTDKCEIETFHLENVNIDSELVRG
jgi:adenosylcobalamin-dependent ribonucleoside-triphosphate reductase